jgi:hypothetical protein
MTSLDDDVARLMTSLDERREAKTMVPPATGLVLH